MIRQGLRVPHQVPSNGGAQGDLSSVLEELRSLNKTLLEHHLRTHPPVLAWGSFPQDGGLEPLPAGKTVLDFKTGQVTAPDKLRTLSADTSFLKLIQSAWMVADSPVTIWIEPGVGRFQLLLTTAYSIEARQIERVTLDADYPFAFQMLFSTSLLAPKVENMVLGQGRFSDTTVTKARAAASADDFSSLLFAPRWDQETLDQSLYGKNIIICNGTGQKVFIVRNVGAVAAEVRVQGGIWPVVAALAEALGGAVMIQDPDIHPAGTGVASFVSVPAYSEAVLETGILYSIIRLQARLPAAQAQAVSTRLLVEYTGMSYAVR